jgi:hypothetical protein
VKSVENGRDNAIEPILGSGKSLYELVDRLLINSTYCLTALLDRSICGKESVRRVGAHSEFVIGARCKE